MDKIESGVNDNASPGEANDKELQVKSRRKFMGTAATGGAVLLTLGSRSAWGTYYGSGGSSWSKKDSKDKSFEKICISAAVYESWRNGDPSSVAHHKKEVEEFSEYWRSDKYKRFTQDQGRKYCVKPKSN
ncbi:MAG: twin-arginine translocation signal domain-containing protein [Porticoccus sp.]|nr:twin-arginine translocation signal domain-containing protein [Porticoccus sp.]